MQSINYKNTKGRHKEHKRKLGRNGINHGGKGEMEKA
jgi:hypothetical protein